MSAAIFGNPTWVWLAVGAGLLAIEVATGSGYLLWAAASAGVVALLHGAGLDLGWAGELVVFAVMAIGSTLAARRWGPRRRVAEGDFLNRPEARLIGREGRAVGDFRDARGRVFVDGKEWAADADVTLADGARVQVLAVIGGSRLRVSSAP